MKRKIHKLSPKKSARIEFDSTEFLLLAFVTVVLLVFVAWQTHLLPKFIADSLVMGVSAAR